MADRPKYRVLVVDDQRDLARAIRMAISELGEAFEAVDVPSAEEALLEAQQRPIDVLVADVRLPGLGGDALVRRIREIWPGVKVILVTGLPREEAQQLARHLAADGLFHKPFEMADLLDTLERLTGEVESVLGATPAPVVSEPEQIRRRLSTLLSEARHTAGLHSLMLIGESGYTLVRAGEYPENVDETRLLPRLLAVLSAGNKVLRLWSPDAFHGMHVFPTPKGTLFMVTIESRFALVAWDEGREQARLTEIGTALWRLATQVTSVLRQWKLLPPHEDVFSAEDPGISEERSPGQESDEVPEELLALLEPQEEHLAPEEAEAFWESLVTEDPGTAVTSADVLSFEEAKRLGLVPFAGEDEDQ